MEFFKMKNIFVTMMVSLFIATNANAYTDPKVGGLITLKKGLESKITKNGVLFILQNKQVPILVQMTELHQWQL